MAISYLDQAYILGLGILAFLISGLDARYCSTYSYDYIECPYGCCGTSYNRYCCSYSWGSSVGYSVGGILFVLFTVLLCCCIRRRRLANSRTVIQTTGPNGVPFVYQTSSNGYAIPNAPPQPYPPPGILGYPSPAVAGSMPPSYIGSPPPAFPGQPQAFAGQPPAFTAPPPAFAAPPPAYSEVVSKTDASNPPAYDNTGFNH
ncbi:extensin-like isoform X2 [Gigantopelta aegis]|uniref:extensin-like isoform X2 n=1 Tax=Gigantopelta aegis TaxID=1735272 RepID=UPI001B88AD66|nr:extensin-like isoform X2 [Gigantopelta aegis]